MSRAGRRVSFFGGKGGVGKTTCAAAAAVRAANEGARVLVVSTDPAHSLADALGLSLGAEAREVPGTKGRLDAAELDADRALRRWLGERKEAIRTIAERGTYLDDEDIDRFLSLSLPGVDELVGLVELMRLARRRAYDEIVVDTAPTGHTLRLLEMPDTLRRLGLVLDDMHAKHRFLASSLGGSWRGDAADATIAGIVEEADALRAMLRDKGRTSFTWVTLAEELPVRESEDGVRAIEALGVEVGAVVVNRAWPPPDRPCALCTPRVAAEAVWRARLAAELGAARLLEVPAMLEEPRGPAALLALARAVRPLAVQPAATPAGKSARWRPSRARARGPSSIDPPVAAGIRLALFGGKGGVGKTTVAAAAAIEIAAARPTARVLVLSTDPAHSLGDALGVEVGDEVRAPLHGAPPNLFARELDASRAWEDLKRRYTAAIDDLFASIFSGRMDATFDRAVLEDLIELAPPGIDEILALLTIVDALGTDPAAHAKGSGARSPGEKGSGARSPGEKGTFDVVVVDTAPTGHTLRLLALPDEALAWVHELMRVILKYRSIIGLGELASDLTTLAKQLRALRTLLSDASATAFVAVTRAAALPRVETERLARDLRRLGVPLASIVANAVTIPDCARCVAAATLERPELDRLGRLARRVGQRPLVETPAVMPPPLGPASLGAWRQRWTERRPPVSSRRV